MTSLMMGQIWSTVVPADEATVRRTAVPYYADKPAAMQDDMPVMGEVETDHDPNLGMVNRQLASKWTEPQRSAPAWADQVATQYEHNATVDRQVSTAGFAPSKEATGEWGHGTMAHAVGIEPVGDLGDQGKLGNDYFKRNDRGIQDTADPTMLTPTVQENVNTSAAGKANARAAAQAALYNTWWNGGN
jgi:hypothetical protein